MYTFHILVLSPIERQMRGAYTHELIAKTPEADQPSREQKRRGLGEDVRITYITTPQHRSMQDTIPTVTVSFKPYTYIPNQIDRYPFAQ
jgi:hypothetical protein